MQLFEDTTVFSPEDIRYYLFWVKPKNDKDKIDSTRDINLGKLDIMWRNLYGDPGRIQIASCKATPCETTRKMDITLTKPCVLKME